jgi:predicted Zn-dependent peptidase
MIKNWILHNKARLVIEEIPYLKSAAVGIFIKVGSRHEPPELSGGSHFIEHMLFKGTSQRSAREIAESFEGIGGQLNAYTSKEYTCVYARTLDENLPAGMEILFDMIFNSAFTERDFETEKGVVMEEINMYEDTPDDLIHDVFAQNIWQGHSMGSPILGTLETVSQFQRDQVFDFYCSSYVPANMIIAVAGNVDSQQIKDLVESHLQNKSPFEADFIIQPPQPSAPFTNMVVKDTEQVQICLGVPGISYFDERRFTQNIMNSILGGGLSSRLFQALREERGLAYSVYSSAANYSDTGAYSIYVGTGPTKLSSFFEALRFELDRFIHEGVTDEEVQRTQRLIKSSMYMGLESVMNRMSRLGKGLLMYDRIVSVEEVMDRVMAVTRDQVNQFAGEILSPDSFSLAAIGTEEALTNVENEFKRWWS